MTIINTGGPLSAGRKSPLPLEATPEAIMVILLDEVAGRLGEMQAKGVTFDDELTVTDTVEERYFPEPLRAIDVFNDGPDILFLAFNEQPVLTRAGLKGGDSIGYNAQRPAFYRIRLRAADSGTATVRLKGFA